MPSKSNPCKRMWINQPSSLQPYHEYHGTNVIASTMIYADGGKLGKEVVCYFLEGDIESMPIPLLCLSEGWINR